MKIGEVVQKVAIPRWSRTRSALTSIMEPVMIIFVGGIVSVIVISMSLPLVSIYNSIK